MTIHCLEMSEIFSLSWHQNFNQEINHEDRNVFGMFILGLLQSFVEHIGPAICDDLHLKTMVTCVSSILSSSTVSAKVLCYKSYNVILRFPKPCCKSKWLRTDRSIWMLDWIFWIGCIFSSWAWNYLPIAYCRSPACLVLEKVLPYKTSNWSINI